MTPRSLFEQEPNTLSGGTFYRCRLCGRGFTVGGQFNTGGSHHRDGTCLGVEIEAEFAALRAEVEHAHGYLSKLLVRRAPTCEPLPDLAGLCTQIDNLICGLTPDPQEGNTTPSHP